ncbi:glycosyl transferases group 1,glycosyl transferase group 1 [Bifidobacterium pseudolongum subsp. globosum]|uniref:glycosyltransferase family 1 protein n=1 Tax=Bifidobacterium pseudolongum TaxID=1694 RepID=UPI0010CEDE15|nr:glycosyltransferase family 1 protein [Bifidobacterium pseudolongum]RYQ14837.1 glycosyl transferases group 1,glycosyl transferase group 1 [Bifidobacterium pseudolongum subsp. globosum]
MERVLNLITSLDRGGAETMIMNYYRHIDRNKVQFDFLVNREQTGAYEAEIQSLGGHIYRMGPMYPGQFGKYKKDFRNFLREHPEYRIIHSHLEERSYFPLRIAKEEGVPVRIAHAHNAYRGFNAKTIFRDYFRHRLPPYPTHKFACSDEAAIWLYGNDALQRNEVKIINNAIDSELYTFSQEKRNEIRKKLDINNTLILGNVGRLTHQKNQSFLIDILSSIKKLHTNAKLLIIGEGELAHELKAHAAAKGIDRDVIFTGSIPNVYDYLQAMDAFVFPSLFEGLGISLIEAQAVGLPAFASDAITQSVNISGKVHFLPLTSGADYWAAQILDHYQERFYSQDMLRKHHYDIEHEAAKLQNFYLEAVKHD